MKVKEFYAASNYAPVSYQRIAPLLQYFTG